MVRFFFSMLALVSQWFRPQYNARLQLMAAQMQDPTMGMMQPPGQGGPGGPGGGMPLSNFSQFMSPQTNSPMQQMAKTPGAGYFGGYYG